MTPQEAKHRQLTVVRAAAYQDLFEQKPIAAFPYHAFSDNPEEPFLIDVFVYPLDVEGETEPVVAAVTNGMSDARMVDREDPEVWTRYELIQYLRRCTEGHARRLHDMAWLPHFDGFALDEQHTIRWEYAAVEGTPWKNAFFLRPLPPPHQEFSVELEGDPVSFLWHVPISDEELAYKEQFGAGALLDRMDAVGLPWIFDESNRPSLLNDDT